MSARQAIRVIEPRGGEDRLPRPADRDGARRRRQGQPPAGRGADRAAPDGRAARNRSATPPSWTSAARGSRVTSDSFVVTPLRFPGGSIGELAVNGTVNDLAVSGARRSACWSRSCSRPGLPSAVLEAEVRAMADAARRAGVPDPRRRHQGRRARQGRPDVRHDHRLRRAAVRRVARRRHASARAIACWCPARSAITASRSCSRAAISTSRPT